MSKKIAIIGLGYVGLPLAIEFGKKYPVIGFDINKERIRELSKGNDITLEATKEQLESAEQLTFSSDVADLNACNIYIVTVPTPVDIHNRPDLSPLLMASDMIGKVLSKGDIVIYESTVYPGCTEYDCVPVLEKSSGMKFNVDFFCGYSPERVNPGDKEHTLSMIFKVTSGSTPEIAETVDQLYRSIIMAGTHKANSIMVAEASKVIENSQRDINIAFVNELAKIFNKLGIDTHEVIEAAGTKWNFLKYKPGLVGGHCIGVDPYYLAQKAIEVGYHPEIILAGRRVNDGMGTYVAQETVKLMHAKRINMKEAEILILGVTFKENCPDVRNTKVIDIVNELNANKIRFTIYDPWASPEHVKHEYQVDTLNDWQTIGDKQFDAVILAVSHQEFKELDYKNILKPNGVIYDVKSFLPKELVDARL
ncbi:MAG: nucleotide sugar dehydrogenase [Bacteroidia bacterium]|jgi:UDP-N-acetyl-D-galactosamine dehydrogenase